ncbi:MAG: cell wall metabolism sensor histidine kinase WalK [FCB group bacterium]|nr:cell wall metabolism sensor histidine kinase WalK [FCB group bacterium]
MLKFRTQASQLFFTYFSVIIVTVSLLGWFLSTSVDRFYYQEKQASLKNQALLISEILPREEIDDPLKLTQFCEKLGTAIQVRITLIDEKGVVLADSDEKPWKMGNHADRPEIVAAREKTIGTSIRYSATLKHEMMYLAYSVEIRGKPLIIRVSLPLTSLEKNIAGIYWKILMGALLIGLAALIASYYIARKIASPLKLMKAVAENYAEGDFSSQLELNSSLEVNSLAGSLNRMARQLDDRIRTISRQKNEQNAILTSMIEAVIAVDNEGKILMINKAAKRMFSIREKNPIGKKAAAILTNSDLKTFIDELVSGKQRLKKELKLKWDFFGQVYVTGTVLEDEEGSSLGAVIVLNDITKIKESEKIRTEFVANVSHELKTPITAIKGYVETLGDLEEPAEFKKFLKIIDKHSDHLNSIVDDLLELSRIEAQENQAQLDFPLEAIRDVFDEALLVCEDLCRQKKIEIRVECTENFLLPMNSRLMREALVNLLNNALKYSDEGSKIILKAVQKGGNLIISVQDFGIGISPKHVYRVFERFYRVDKARSKKLGGTGLGLSIVKHIANVHKGRVWVKSQKGKGSIFYLKIPMMRTP